MCSFFRPENISSIHNPELRDFAIDLNEKWKVLGRKVYFVIIPCKLVTEHWAKVNDIII